MREFINCKFKSFRSIALLIGGIAFLAILLLLDRQKPVEAFSSYLDQAEAQYPGIVGSRIDNCLLCHNSPSGGSLNPYGSDFGSNNHDFTAIENMDSDLDTYLNIDEINALTYPGDPADPPAATSTPTPTATGQPPTATPTPTTTGQPPTATHTPTTTGQPPTATHTPTTTGQPPTATPTVTPRPTAISGNILIHLPEILNNR